MSTGRELAYEHLKVIVPLTMVLWRNPFPETAAIAQECNDAKTQLNDRLGLALSEIESYYDEELIALLRSTSSVKRDLPTWQALFENTVRLFESRHGVDKMKSLMVGML